MTIGRHDRALRLIDELVDLLQQMPIPDSSGRTDVTVFTAFGQSLQHLVVGVEYHKDLAERGMA